MSLSPLHPAPVLGSDGELGTRRIRAGSLLGTGPAGTVYEIRDADGTLFVEKHYGEIPAHGAHRFGRWLTALLFSLFRQAPLSFRAMTVRPPTGPRTRTWPRHQTMSSGLRCAQAFANGRCRQSRAASRDEAPEPAGERVTG